MAAEGGPDPTHETLSTAHAEDENENDNKFFPETRVVYAWYGSVSLVTFLLRKV